MAQYINKDALAAEIESIKGCKKSDWHFDEFDEGYKSALEDILSFIDSLEVKEVYLDEVKIGETQIYIEDDGGEPPYDGKQWLDLKCLEYEIPKDKFKDGDNVEIIIRKAQKGE